MQLPFSTRDMSRCILALVIILPLFGGCRDTGGWSLEVDRLVQGLIDEYEEGAGVRGDSPLVVFDFDNTMINGDISFNFLVSQVEGLQYGFNPADPESRVFSAATTRLFKELKATKDDAARSGLTRRIVGRVLRRYHDLWDEQGKEIAYAFFLQLLSGMTVEEVHRHTVDAFSSALRSPTCLRSFGPANGKGRLLMKQAGLRTRPPVKKMVDRLKGAGFDVRVVTASPKRIVEAVVGHYGIPPEHVLGNRSVEKGGRLTKDVLPPITYRQGKVDAIEKYIGRMPVLVFGDAWTDWEMLNRADHGVLIDRGRDDLNKAALKAGILIQPRFDGETEWAPCDPGNPNPPPAS